uniref:Protein TsetseEP domain-containing protein n=1 Tax=Megaselia scalaris TaxID=36166 RepID=T1GXR0_MEGSC
MVCYQESSAALQEVATKSAEGNTKCNNILTNAQTQADNELEENRKTLDEESQDIQISLTSCDASTLPNAADALECYETQGQKNVNPVSSLSSKSRSYRRGYENTLNLAKTASDGCSYDVASESEQISAQIFNNLNSCITSGQWDPVDIPDFGPAEPTTKAPTTVSTVAPTTEDNSVPDPETTLEPEI